MGVFVLIKRLREREKTKMLRTKVTIFCSFAHLILKIVLMKKVLLTRTKRPKDRYPLKKVLENWGIACEVSHKISRNLLSFLFFFVI